MALASPVPENEFSVGTEEDHEFLKQLVVSLFTDRENREIDVDSDEAGLGPTGLAAAAAAEDVDKQSVDGESKPVDDVAEIARFNNYMDAVYRRMNAAVRAKMMDPMVLNLSDKGDKKAADAKRGKAANKKSDKSTKKTKKDKKDRKKKKRKSRNLAADDDDAEMSTTVEEDEDDEDAVTVVDLQDESVGRKMTKKERKSSNAKGAKGKGKNKGRGKMSAVDKKASRAEKKKLRKAERKVNKKDQPNGKKNEKKTKSEKKEKNKKNRESRGDEFTRTRRNKHSNNEKEGKKLSKGKKEEFSGKSMGSLAGIATLRRSGDVVLLDAGTHKVVKSEFSIGPLQLEVSKTFGNGKSRSVKTAKAVTEELIGKITLKVKPDGSAHVKSVSFKKPEKVDIRGSLGDQKKRSDNYLKNSVGKMRPMAAQRLLKMARYVLKSPSTVERS